MAYHVMRVLYIKGSTQAVRLMQKNYLPIWLPDDDERVLDEGARNPDQAEPEVAHVRHSTWVRRQQGWISAMLFKILVKLKGVWE